jgi:hypothetical protein
MGAESSAARLIARQPRETTSPTSSYIDFLPAPVYNNDSKGQAMKWEIDYKKEDGIVIVKTSGLATWDDIKLMTQETFAAAKHHNTKKALVDHRLLQTNLTILQIDDLPKLFRETGIGPEYKVAILFEPTAPRSGNFTFFENVSIISSLQFRVFSVLSEAIEWLKAKT